MYPLEFVLYPYGVMKIHARTAMLRLRFGEGGGIVEFAGRVCVLRALVGS